MQHDRRFSHLNHTFRNLSKTHCINTNERKRINQRRALLLKDLAVYISCQLNLGLKFRLYEQLGNNRGFPNTYTINTLTRRSISG